jgi:hypothetical protein
MKKSYNVQWRMNCGRRYQGESVSLFLQQQRNHLKLTVLSENLFYALENLPNIIR